MTHVDQLEEACRERGWRMALSIRNGNRSDCRNCTVLHRLGVWKRVDGQPEVIIDAEVYNGLPETLDETADVLLEAMKRNGILL